MSDGHRRKQIRLSAWCNTSRRARALERERRLVTAIGRSAEDRETRRHERHYDGDRADTSAKRKNRRDGCSSHLRHPDPEPHGRHACILPADSAHIPRLARQAPQTILHVVPLIAGVASQRHLPCANTRKSTLPVASDAESDGVTGRCHWKLRHRLVLRAADAPESTTCL